MCTSPPRFFKSKPRRNGMLSDVAVIGKEYQGTCLAQLGKRYKLLKKTYPAYGKTVSEHLLRYYCRSIKSNNLEGK